jgi:hypothetical protein
VDENTITPGQEKPVVSTASRLLDELAAGDQAAVITLPLTGNVIRMAADAATRASILTGVRGRAAPLDANPAANRADEELKSVQEAGDQAAAASRVDPDDPNRVVERQQQSMQAQQLARADKASNAEPPKPRVATVRALRPIVEGFRTLPGLKSVVLVQQADAADPGDVAQHQRDLAALVESAVRSRAVLHVVAVGINSKKGGGDAGLRQAALATGGTFTAVKLANTTKSYDALRGALSGGYLLEVETRPGDANGRPHALRVEVARNKASVRSAQSWVPRADPAPKIVVNTAAPGVAPAAAPAVGPVAGSPKRPKRVKPPDAELTLLIARMREYLQDYVRDFANVVTEEDSVMEITRGWRGGEKSRHLKSDLLLVKTNDRTGWLQYRDVFEVDGKPVRDRESRVQKLFLENPAAAVQKAEEISNESARYNLGELRRTMNLPTLPLVLFASAGVGGLSFERDGEDTLNGIRAARIKYEELQRPTLVRQIETSLDAPSSGTVWIDPLTGRVLKTLIEVEAAQSTAIMTVVYKPGGTTGIWAPTEMQEVYRRPGYEVTGRATYSKFRSFKVTTDVTIAK